MITPITELAEKTAFLTKFTQIFGNTLDYDQNIDGDWTQMKTKKWPIILIPVIIFLWTLPYGYACIFIYPEKGHKNPTTYDPNIKVEIIYKIIFQESPSLILWKQTLLVR